MKRKYIIKKINGVEAKSFWERGVKEYAVELVEELDNNIIINKHNILNGAQDFSQFSYSGLTLIYDEDIATRLCTPSELKKKKNGKLLPNAYENWLDVQARALYQAFELIKKLDLLNVKIED